MPASSVIKHLILEHRGEDEARRTRWHGKKRRGLAALAAIQVMTLVTFQRLVDTG